MSDEKYVILVSELVANVPEGEEWPGSVVRWCHICGDAIWLSQEAIRKIDTEADVRPVCPPCGVPMMEAEAKTRKVTVHQVDPQGAPIRPVLDYLKERYGRGH